MHRSKVLPLLGISMKAGKIAAGEAATEKAVRSGSAYLVILSEDASGNTKKKFSDMCRFYGVPVACCQNKAVLGAAIGKGDRSNLAVLDPKLAEKIRIQIEAEQNMEERSVL